MMDDRLNWNALKKRSVDGIVDLVLAVAQDYKTSEVLMVAFMNREAFEKTVEVDKVHYYSTSRNKVWLKGESSGNVQYVKELYVDCDMDALLIKVEQKGGACHTGYRSCFYRRNTSEGLEVVGERIFNPDEVYKK